MCCSCAMHVIKCCRCQKERERKAAVDVVLSSERKRLAAFGALEFGTALHRYKNFSPHPILVLVFCSRTLA